eukprot:12939893-Alexandrium_andersonii.AAC.1
MRVCGLASPSCAAGPAPCSLSGAARVDLCPAGSLMRPVPAAARAGGHASPSCAARPAFAPRAPWRPPS